MKYPFTPELLDSLPEELAELYRSLELKLLDEICSRLKIAGELNEVTVQDIRALRSHGIDLSEIEKLPEWIANAIEASESYQERIMNDPKYREFGEFSDDDELPF